MGLLSTLREQVEERTGLTVRSAAEVNGLEEASRSFEAFSNEASEMAWGVYDYLSGRPQEMRAEKRQRLAQRARIALARDPLAGAEAEHYANFALGRGVGRPRAKNEAVQKVIDAAWTDANNAAKLTNVDAQRAISHELRSGANVFITAYIQSGKVRVGFLSADSVTDVVADPEDRLRPLWYLTREQKLGWDFVMDRPEVPTLGALPEPRYYAHWANVDDARRERKERGDKPLTEPPADKLGEGVVYHVRINRTLEQHFGMPPWARTLRFHSAMNSFVEARSSMAQAAASFIAKRVLKGGQKDVIRAAQSILTQTGEIGSAHVPSPQPPPGMKAAPAPASIITENESSRLESLSLNSGASAAVQDAQILRSAAIAPSGFGPHYYGDLGAANLAGAVSLELPALMAVGSFQEVFEGFLRWFTTLAIQEAIRAGTLSRSALKKDDRRDKEKKEREKEQKPDVDAPDDEQQPDLTRPNRDRPLEELSLFEEDEREEVELRLEADLSYTFEMPYPGRRNLPEVNASFEGVLRTMGGVKNEPLVRRALNFLFTHGWQLEDASEAVEEIIEEQVRVSEQEREDAEMQWKAAQGAPPPGEPGGPPPGQPEPGTGRSVYGERRGRTPPGDEMGEEEWLPDDLRGIAAGLSGEAESIFREVLTDPAVTAAAALNGAGHA